MRERKPKGLNTGPGWIWALSKRLFLGALQVGAGFPRSPFRAAWTASALMWLQPVPWPRTHRVGQTPEQGDRKWCDSRPEHKTLLWGKERGLGLWRGANSEEGLALRGWQTSTGDPTYSTQLQTARAPKPRSTTREAGRERWESRRGHLRQGDFYKSRCWDGVRSEGSLPDTGWIPLQG